MVLGDEGAHRGRYAVALGQIEPGLDVVGDHFGAGRGRQLVMGILALDLVLDVVHGLGHLADVMEVAAHPRQQRVGAHQIGRPLGQVADDDAMVEGAWGLLLKPPQQGVVELGQLHQLHAGSDAEHQPQYDRGAHDDNR